MNEPDFPPPPPTTLLIVDDEPANVRVLSHALKLHGHADLHSTTDPREVEALYETRKPDLVLLDLLMPHLDGYEVMRRLRARVPAGSYLPILVLTADATHEARRKALAQGASDFLTKPFDVVEVGLRVRNLLQVRVLMQTLETQVEERTRDLLATRAEMIERLAVAAEYRDDDTGQHTRRVGGAAAEIARELGLDSAEVEVVRQAAPLHDIGKIAVPDHILLKPGRLTADEFGVVQSHAAVGGRILSGARFEVLRAAEEIARTHHERWDGTGYPAGLSGESIPLHGRIVAVADVFDALTHDRPYKAAWPPARALAEVQAQAGRQFDPAVVAAFARCLPRLLAGELADAETPPPSPRPGSRVLSVAALNR